MANAMMSLSSALPTNQTLPEPEFVDTANPPICVNCEHTLRPPVFQTECGHRLCAKCADSLFQNNEHVTCPGKEEDCVKLTPAQVGIRVFNAFLFLICNFPINKQIRIHNIDIAIFIEYQTKCLFYL